MIMMKKRIFLLLILLACLLLCSCGAEAEKSQIDQGMDALEALDFAAAANCFDAALANGEDAQLAYRGRGMAMLGLNRYPEAREAFEKALSQTNGRIH